MMDYLEVYIGNSRYKRYGKIGDFVYERNYEVVPNPGGNFIMIYKGVYTEPVEIEFELFEPESRRILPDIDSTASHHANIYIQRSLREYACVIYNLKISDINFCKVIKGTDEVPAGYYYLTKGKFVAYHMRSMYV